MPWTVQLYLVCVWVTGAIFLFWGLYRFTWSPQILSVALFVTGLIWLLDQFPIVLGSDAAEVTLSVSVAIAAIMLLPLPFAPLIAFLGTGLAELRLERAWYKKGFNTGQMVIVYTTVAWAFRYAGDSNPLVLDSIQDVGAIAVLWGGNYVLNVGLVSLAIALAQGLPLPAVWRTNFRDVFYHEITTVPLGAMLALLVQRQPLAIVLVLPSLAALRQSFKLTREMRQQSIDALLAFADSIDARDPSTYQHSQRVAQLASDTAEEMGLPPDQVETIQLSARLHDLGKVGTPDALLLGAGKLSDQEYAMIKEHTVIGAQIVDSFPVFGVGRDLIKHHHEWFNGEGYPDGLAGDEIPLGARIIAVADAYDAMTSDRTYRPARSKAAALSELHAGKDSQFDPEVVEAFMEMFRSQREPPESETGGTEAHQMVRV